MLIRYVLPYSLARATFAFGRASVVLWDCPDSRLLTPSLPAFLAVVYRVYLTHANDSLDRLCHLRPVPRARYPPRRRAESPGGDR